MTCDCLNDCGDDPWLKDGSGRAQPCDMLAARQEHARVISERLATITALRANYGADNVFELIELMHAEVVRLDAVQRSLFARGGEIPATSDHRLMGELPSSMPLTFGTVQYATAEETAALVRQVTPDEKWLQEQLDRIDPHRHEMGSAGDVAALTKLVMELRDTRTRLQGEAKVMRSLLEKSLIVMDTIDEEDDHERALLKEFKAHIAAVVEAQLVHS